MIFFFAAVAKKKKNNKRGSQPLSSELIFTFSSDFPPFNMKINSSLALLGEEEGGGGVTLGSCAAFQSMSGSVMTSTTAHASVQARRVGVQLNGPECYRAACSYSAAQRVFSQMSRTSNSACKRRRVASLAASVGAPSGPSLGRVIVNDARATFGVSGAIQSAEQGNPK